MSALLRRTEPNLRGAMTPTSRWMMIGEKGGPPDPRKSIRRRREPIGQRRVGAFPDDVTIIWS